MILKGNRHEDIRGIITYNNEFDATKIKRIYTIENHSTEFVRGWQGHKIEQRWFACMKGKFEISVIVIDDFDNPSTNAKINKYILSSEALTYLHIHAGCLTAIQSLEEESKLLVLADYELGEIEDEYRFELDYFK
ncbi:WxcM-like domain-containing protein [Chryseobacterium sp. PTM-20240506]|uniref:WxcM-like domain-containing protein n=1 Tax=unclassified Chryseobacterium TaxID=2593645 RepID=UPI0023596CDA|nr:MULTISPECIES: WxcM-like domain-containing protein [unclassified Chryseobacterium]MDC8105120.1 WxcM-like domain-containing protein [Chryseobacterium sp. B21-037]MDQ1805377.1 WxcM-like domain-containing protein [Chryseobacterium sp. CKR4-1]